MSSPAKRGPISGGDVWRLSIVPRLRSAQPANPTIDGDRVYVFTWEGKLLCLWAANGSELWRRDYSREKARKAGVQDLVTIEQGDLFDRDLSQADVVVVYLQSALLERLKPQFAKLKPAARIVSHHFPLPDVEPTRTELVESDDDDRKHELRLYVIPLKTQKGTAN